jgi:hypothetical protein
MLDPDLSYRITSRQLTALICHPEYYYSSVLNASRTRCVGPAAIEDSNLPLHSVFKDVNALEYPISAEQGLKLPVAQDWEAVKRKWLQHHIRW